MRWLLPVLVLSVPAALAIGPAGLDAALIASLRAPRVVAAVVAGAGLALAGIAMQTLLRNALAEPYVLGMSGGASLGAVAAVLAGAWLPPALAASLGALAAAALVAGIGRTAEGLLPPTRLLLAGVAVAAVLGAATGFLLQVTPQVASVRAALYWTAGNLGAASFGGALAVAAAVALAAGWLWWRGPDLDRLLLGEDAAASLGVDVRRSRASLVLLGSVLTGAIVAIGGPIGFVGLVAPHLGRMSAGAVHRRLVPVSAGLGAVLLLWADTVARAAFAPRELPVGVITAVLGGPFFLLLLRGRRYGFGELA